MGLDYFVVNHERKTAFEVGKEMDWYHKFKPEHLLYPSSILEYIRDVYSNRELYTEENGWTEEYLKDIAMRLAIFVDKTPPEKIEVVCAYDLEKLTGYRVTNGRYSPEEYEELRGKK